MYSEKPLLHARQRAHRAGDLRTIALDVTSTCNMTCAKCYAETFVGTESVPLETLTNVLDQFYQLGVFHYVLQGGEAILDPVRLESILTHCHPDETYINVISNGWGMGRDRIRWLKERKVDKICFSLDSGIPEEHDSDRLNGSYGRTMSAIEDVLAEGLLCSVSTVVTHQSLYSEGFNRVVDLVVAKQMRLDVQIAEPVGKWDGKKEMLITPDDAAYIKDLRAKLGQLPNGQAMINRDIYSGDFDHCPAGTEFMALSVDGNLLPCNFLQYSLGNVRDRSVKEMRDALLANPWFDGRRPNCIIGEDHTFIDSFVTPYVDHPKPLDAHAVFGLGTPKDGTP